MKNQIEIKYKTGSKNSIPAVIVNAHVLDMKCNCTVMLPQQIGIYLTINELKKIPFLIEICDQVKKGNRIKSVSKPHAPTILEYSIVDVKLGIMIFSPTKNFHRKINRQVYLNFVQDILINDKTIGVTFLQINKNYNQIDIDEIMFTVNIAANNLTDIIHEADKISYKIENQIP